MVLRLMLAHITFIAWLGYSKIYASNICHIRQFLIAEAGLVPFLIMSLLKPVSDMLMQNSAAGSDKLCQ